MVRNTRQISFWHKTCINKGQDTVAAGVVLFHFLPWVCRSKVLLLLLSRFSRVWLCDPRDGSPRAPRPYSPHPSPPPFPGILQARTLEWVAISSSNAWKWKVKVIIAWVSPISDTVYRMVEISYGSVLLLPPTILTRHADNTRCILARMHEPQYREMLLPQRFPVHIS